MHRRACPTPPGEWQSDSRMYANFRYAPRHSYGLTVKLSPCPCSSHSSLPWRIAACLFVGISNAICYSLRLAPGRFSIFLVAFWCSLDVGVSLSPAFVLGSCLSPNSMRYRPIWSCNFGWAYSQVGRIRESGSARSKLVRVLFPRSEKLLLQASQSTAAMCNKPHGCHSLNNLLPSSLSVSFAATALVYVCMCGARSHTDASTFSAVIGWANRIRSRLWTELR